MKGRRPKPAALKVLCGERADRINQREPLASRAMPLRPDHLDGYGREAWDRLAPQLHAIGVLTEIDGDALSLYCAAYSRWRMARDEIAANGIITETAMGGPKGNPATTVAAQAERMMATLLNELGLTPTSRSRIKTAVEAPKDKFAEFISRQGKRKV